jgi:hypothetical protein
MGSEISSLVALIEVQRATAAYWGEGPELDRGPGNVRRAVNAAGRALVAIALWARGGQGVGAQTDIAPRSA